MALVNPYCTLVQLQKEIKNEDADDDAAVLAWHEDCINRAARMVDEYCQRDFLFHDHSASKLSPKERWIVGKDLFLPWPVKTLTAVELDSEVQDTDDYRFDVGERMIHMSTAWPFDTLDNTFIELTGTFGYGDGTSTAPPDDTTFPPNVTRAAILIAAALTGDHRKEHMNKEGQVQSLLTTDVPVEAKALLHRHRLMLPF